MPANPCIPTMCHLHQMDHMYTQQCETITATHLVASDQTAARATPVQQQHAGCVCTGNDCLISRRVSYKHHFSIFPAYCQQWLGGMPAQGCGLVRTLHMTALNTLPLQIHKENLFTFIAPFIWHTHHNSSVVNTGGSTQRPSRASDCWRLPAAGIDPHCLHCWSWSKLQLIKEAPSARLNERAHHCCQGLRCGGRSTPPCRRCSSPPESKPHH